MIKKIPWAQPLIGKEELLEIKDCFKNDRFTQGDKVKKFEKYLSKITNSKYLKCGKQETIIKLYEVIKFEENSPRL